MDALILAAGFGTRLRPLTEEIPKALLPIYGIPMIDIHIERLLGNPLPIGPVTVNAHHLSDDIRSHIHEHRYHQLINLSYEPTILGTGGAIKNASPFLRSDPFIVLNCDAIFLAPICSAISFHNKGDQVATMVLIRSPVWPNVKVNRDRVTAILRERRDPDAYTFTGFHIISQEIFDLLPDDTFYDIRDAYQRLIEDGKLGAFIWDVPSETPFLDIGTPESYLEAHRLYAGDAGKLMGVFPDEEGITLAEGYGFIDDTAVIGEGSRIEESIVLSGAMVAPGSNIQRSILGPGAEARGDVRNRLVTISGSREISE